MKRFFAVFLVCAAVFACAGQSVFAQSRSGKRSHIKVRAHQQVRHLGEPVEAKEFDVRIGEVVAAEGDRAVVKIKAHQIHSNWGHIYYACDGQFNAVAVLERMGAHASKSCVLFQIKNGTARKGDTVFLKQIPPENS